MRLPLLYNYLKELKVAFSDVVGPVIFVVKYIYFQTTDSDTTIYYQEEV